MHSLLKLLLDPMPDPSVPKFIPCMALVDGKPCNAPTDVMATVTFDHPVAAVAVGVPLCEEHACEYRGVFVDDNGESRQEWTEATVSLGS